MKSTSRSKFISSLILLIFFGQYAAGQYIHTIVGNGVNGNSGDTGPAVCGQIAYPYNIGFDGKNSIYLHCVNSIRKVDLSSGIITTIAGSNTYGFSGDGGPAKDALLQAPFAVHADSANNMLYIGEYSTGRIRSINLNTGIINTIAGTGVEGYSGDGGPATSAMLNKPKNFCMDYKGYLYVADLNNSRIRRINLTTGIITTFAGTGSTVHSGDGGLAVNAGIPFPNSICSDSAGNIYLIEVYSYYTSRLRKIDAQTGIITTLAGRNSNSHSGDGGPAVDATLFDPSGVFIDNKKNIYISQYIDSRIRKIDGQTGIISTIAGNGNNGFSGDGGLGINAQLHYPIGLTMDRNDNLYVADNTNNRIRKISLYNEPPSTLTTILINANSTNICAGNEIVFKSIVTNVGANPYYQWKKNGINVGDNDSTYSTNLLVPGDSITCVLRSYRCGVPIIVSSNTIITNVQAVDPPLINISASNINICSGMPVVFTALATNAGSKPRYQWMINGVNTGVGDSSKTFTSAVLSNGSRVSCRVFVDSSYGCATVPNAISNEIEITVTNGNLPSVNLAASDLNPCPEIAVNFSATFSNAGNNPIFEWWINGQKQTNNSPEQTGSFTAGNNQIWIILRPDLTTCYSQMVFSDTLAVNVKTVPWLEIINKDTTIKPGEHINFRTNLTGVNNLTSFSWEPTDKLENPGIQNAITYPLFQDTRFTLKATTNDGCEISSNVALVKISGSFFMPNAFTPNGDHINDIFRIPTGVNIDLISFNIYDRWGNKIFTTTDLTKGWDGMVRGKESVAGTYIYQIEYIEANARKRFKESFRLIR